MARAMKAGLDTASRRYAIQDIEVDKLLLDPENPRLASLSNSDAPAQAELIEVLWREMAVDELAMSIAANGFFPEEPLFVIPAGRKALGKYVVIEGNRRLAAVMILLDDSLREALRAEELPSLTQAGREKLKKLPVSVYDSRRELWAFLSFRHINSAKPWDPYSKAKYIGQVHEEYGVPLEEIADRIGDKHDTVIRLFRGLRVLRQAERANVFDVADRAKGRFYFSHFYTALNYPEFQEFLGISDRTADTVSPVPKQYIDELRDLLGWIYGQKSKGVLPIVRKQNPDIGRLRVAIQKPQSLSLLRRGYSLDQAHVASIGDSRRFLSAISAAKSELQLAKGMVATGFKGERTSKQLVDDILDLAQSLHEEVSRKSRGR